jgi:F-type H+-transporting ATPase subunit b
MKRIIGNIALGTSAAFAAVLSMPTLAFAEEENTRTGVALLVPELGEFVPMVIGFIVLWIILAKLAWPAFMGMIDKRTKGIKDAMESAEGNRVESERLLEEQKADLADAKKQAAEIVAQAKQTAEGVRADITAQAQSEAESLISKARGAIETERKATIAALQSSAADLSIAVAGRIIGSDLDDTEHRKIVERYLAQAGSFDGN